MATKDMNVRWRFPFPLALLCVSLLVFACSGGGGGDDGDDDPPNIPDGPTVSIVNGCDNLYGDLCPALGNFSSDVFDKSKSSEGYTLLMPVSNTSAFLLDHEGNTVKSWETGYFAGQTSYLLEDGSLLRAADTGNPNFQLGGRGGRVELYDYEGALLWSYEHSGDTYVQHHDIEPLPNGNVLLIVWEKLTKNEAMLEGRDESLFDEGQFEIWLDYIVEVKPTYPEGGEIVWAWYAKDHLVQDHDPAMRNLGVVADNPGKIDINAVDPADGYDLTHFNSIYYIEDYDQILVSVREYSEIWVIDHSTTTIEAASSHGGISGKGGEILYRWGNPQMYGHGTEDDRKLFLQHDAQIIPEGYPGAGNVLIYNNGDVRVGRTYSTVEEITMNRDASGNYPYTQDEPYLPLDATWRYVPPAPAILYSPSTSSAQRLVNGNTLICEGQGYPPKIIEITGDGTIVWQFDYTADGYTAVVFRARRFSPTYPGLEMLTAQ